MNYKYLITKANYWIYIYPIEYFFFFSKIVVAEKHLPLILKCIPSAAGCTIRWLSAYPFNSLQRVTPLFRQIATPISRNKQAIAQQDAGPIVYRRLPTSVHNSASVLCQLAGGSARSLSGYVRHVLLRGCLPLIVIK